MATDVPTIAPPDLGPGAEQLAREVFADAARRLAEEFGAAAEAAVGALGEGGDGGGVATAPAAPDREAAPTREAAPVPEGEHPSLYRPGQLRRRLDQLIETSKRYEQPFALVVFDVEGPGVREGERGGGRETALAVTGAALGESVRLVDETFRLEEDALCVLAPCQSTVGGVQMAERLLSQLDELEAAGGLPIGITAGVVACPEHGADAEALLRKADEAMWRARAVGQPVGVGSLQDR
jgi:diguanylate cyclase (GGDEF)-like protein